MKRLLAAFLIAIGLHAALFFIKLADPQMIRPRPLEFKKIMVSLADIESPAPDDNHFPPMEKAPAELTDQPISKEKTIAHVEPPAPNPIQNTIKPLRPVQRKKPIEKQQRKTPAPVVPLQKKEIIKTQEDFSEQNTSTPARSSVAGNVIQEAVPLLQYNHPPPYPRAARRRGFEGLVEVNVLVDLNGRVK
ncbi:MAG: hypothetical protein KAQ71_09510 [Desulfobulbaceae bacterium]|nr:hypothetical protein [Desulfobulbaceae bacterium]